MEDGVMNISRVAVALVGSILVAAFVLLPQRVDGGRLSEADFAKVKSLKDAVELVQRSLKDDGKADYAALLSEDRVRQAIRTAIQSYEAGLDVRERQTPGSKEYFRNEAKPVFEKIADKGEWPAGCSFFSFYKLTDRGICYEGLGLRLQLDTPKAQFKGFALPVLDVYFGRFAVSGD
jgi:hypothetical protein